MTEIIEKPTLDVVADINPQGHDITRGYLLPLLIPQDKTLTQKGGWGLEFLEIYEKLLEDPQVNNCYQQRFKRLTRCQLEVTPASQSRADKKAADWIRALIDKLPMDSITERMLLGIHFGFSVAEKMLTIDDSGMISLNIEKGGIRVRNRRRFRFDRDMKPRLLTFGNMYEGEPLPPSRIWTMNFGGTNDDDPYGEGLGGILYWLCLFKRGNMRHWLNFLETFTNPSAKVTYPVSASPEEKKTALKLARDLKAGAAVAFAEGLTAELVEANRGTADFQGLYDRCDSAIAKVILSQTSTSQDAAWAGTSAVHNEVALDIITSDGDMFSNSFMKNVVTPLCFFNYPDSQPPIVAYKTSSEEDVNTRVDRDKKLFDFGVKPTPELIAEVYGDGYEYIANQTLLNGAQLTALTTMITAASMRQMPPDSLVQIMVSTMGVPIEAAQAIIAPIRNQPQPQNIAPQDATSSNQVSTQDQTQDKAPSPQNSTPQFSEIRSGDIYDFLEKKLDTVEQIANNLAPSLETHLATWQERIEIARKESSDFVEFQERIAGIFEGMAKSRQKLATEAAKAHRVAYLSGIEEAEDGN